MRIPVALYLVALVARAISAVGFPHPGYPDSAYYIDVAREIAAGNGLSVPFVWVFAEVGGRIPLDPVLPVASNAHWMPLASFVQVPFILVLGPTVLASTLPFLLIGALAAPLTWAIGRDAGLRPPMAVAAGILAAIPGFSLVFMPQQDNFALIEVLTAGALFLASRGLRGDGRAFVVAGLLAGLATLARTDAGLILVVLGLAFLWDRWRTRRGFGTGPPRPARISVRAAAGAVAAWLLVMGPWFARQLAVFGTISPSSASGKVLWIRDFSEWNDITTPASPAHFFGMGLGPLLESRVVALGEAVTIFTVIGASLVLLPFMAYGAWRRCRDVRFGPALAYAGLFLVVSVLLFAPHVPGGMFIHSGIGLLPHAFVLAVEAIVALAGWLATRGRARNPERIASILVVLVIAYAGVASVVGVQSAQLGWAERLGRMQAAADAIDGTGALPDERIMALDVSGYRYLAGRTGVVAVNDPLETIAEVGRAYDIRWLIVEPDEMPGSAVTVLGAPLPEWVGDPVLDRPDVTVYPLCFDPADSRCQR